MRGFPVGWELQSPEPTAPGGTHSILHTFPAPSMQGVGLGSGDESDTVPAHGEPAVCRRELYTHKLPSSEVAGDQCTETGTRHKLGLRVGVKGGLYPSSESWLKRTQRSGPSKPSSCCGFPPGKKGLQGSHPSHAGLMDSQSPFLQCYTLAQSFGVSFLKEGVGYTQFLLFTLPHCVNNSILRLCHPDPPAELPQGRSNVQ